MWKRNNNDNLKTGQNYLPLLLIRAYLVNKPIKESISKLLVILLAECEKEINNWLDKQFTLRQAHIFLLEKWNEEDEMPDDGGVETVILLA